MRIPFNYPNQSGSIRFSLLLLAVVGFLFWSGGQGLYTALSNRKPTVMGYDQYVKEKPNSAWISLTNCILDMTDASYRTVKGSSTPMELFIPVHGVEEKSQQIQVMLATKSPELMATLREMQGLKSEQDATAWALKNQERVFPHRDVSGLVRFGLDMNEKDRSKIKELQANLANDFIILDDGKAPSLGKSLGFLVGGVMVLGIIIMMFLRNRQASATDV
jgi:hypothetical protein